MTAIKNSSKGLGGAGEPSDLDLMLYLDGELEPDRSAEIEAAVVSDSALRQKLAALQLGSDLLVESIEAQVGARADGIADAVMGKIAAADAEIEPDRGATSPRRVEPPPGLAAPAANDNRRTIFAMAAVAVAAAAGMMIWGRVEPAVPRLADTTAPREPAAAAAPPTGTGQDPAPSPDGEIDVDVEVAAVDFGAQSGAIFYVPSEAPLAGHTTTVVWLADDLGGGE